jgi:hypothetical protein
MGQGQQTFPEAKTTTKIIKNNNNKINKYNK